MKALCILANHGHLIHMMLTFIDDEVICLITEVGSIPLRSGFGAVGIFVVKWFSMHDAMGASSSTPLQEDKLFGHSSV